MVQLVAQLQVVIFLFFFYAFIFLICLFAIYLFVAGHDNCNYDSYEKQLERTLKPVWEAAGLTVTVRNAGEGGGCGDSHQNQVFCIVQNVGEVDIVHYSWTYFENHNLRGVNEHESVCIFFMFILVCVFFYIYHYVFISWFVGHK